MIIKRRLFSAVVKWGYLGYLGSTQHLLPSTWNAKYYIAIFNFRESIFRMDAHFLSPFSNAHVRRIRECWVRNAQLHLDDYIKGKESRRIYRSHHTLFALALGDP